ncbi:MAG: transcriptional repressor LexA [Oscillospiraceae bacterium]|jgi:repressor LexA|nr:transcriptional repressor LexA [Oscillospiraceae bacterium]
MGRRKITSGLNETQQKMYEFLLQRSQQGVAPSVREIAEYIGVRSTSSVQYNLRVLQERGYIDRGEAMSKRSIRITGTEQPIIRVPLLGTVTAGLPILAVEEIEAYIPYVGSSANDKSIFALRIQGESMINKGIYDKDIIFVEKASSASNGEIVVAMIDDEATVKTFYKEDGRFRLQPENDTMEPIYTDQVSILGKVIGLTREMGNYAK